MACVVGTLCAPLKPRRGFAGGAFTCKQSPRRGSLRVVTPDEWRRRAADYDAKAKAFAEAGNGKEALVWALAADTALQVAEQLEQRPRRKRLPAGVNTRTVNTVLSSDHRVAISGGRAPKNKLAAAARAAGMSMRDLAKKVGVSVALLSMAASGNRSLKRQVAEQIERLTGYRVSNWPTLA